MHKSPVTTVEWSKNGMKLFSGDQEGTVVLTEIDFYMVFFILHFFQFPCLGFACKKFL